MLVLVVGSRWKSLLYWKWSNPHCSLDLVLVVCSCQRKVLIVQASEGAVPEEDLLPCYLIPCGRVFEEVAAVGVTASLEEVLLQRLSHKALTWLL